MISIAVATKRRLLLVQTVLGPGWKKVVFRQYLVLVCFGCNGERFGPRVRCAWTVLISAWRSESFMSCAPGTGFITWW